MLASLCGLSPRLQGSAAEDSTTPGSQFKPDPSRAKPSGPSPRDRKGVSVAPRCWGAAHGLCVARRPPPSLSPSKVTPRDRPRCRPSREVSAGHERSLHRPIQLPGLMVSRVPAGMVCPKHPRIFAAGRLVAGRGARGDLHSLFTPDAAHSPLPHDHSRIFLCGVKSLLYSLNMMNQSFKKNQQTAWYVNGRRPPPSGAPSSVRTKSPIACSFARRLLMALIPTSGAIAITSRAVILPLRMASW